MIVVDSSVWIDFFAKRNTKQVDFIRTIDRASNILVGDVILLEVLRGARNADHAAVIERLLRYFEVAPLLDPDLAVTGATNYRFLRSKGVTVRSVADVIIGTFCIERGHALLHNDRDFDPMVEHLGLRLA